MPPIEKMPDFSRVIWSNKADKWREIISQVSTDWNKFELLSVQKRHRCGAIINVSPDSFPEFQKNQNEEGLQCIILNKVGITDNSYSSNTTPITGKYDYRVLVYRANTIPYFNYKDSLIGIILGYPDCCIKFFEEYWNKQKYVDTTWPMFERSKSLHNTNNILLRYLGIRAVFHLPCSFDCLASNAIAHENRKNFANYFPESAKYLREILCWPVEWSAVNGIAEIKFPLGKIMARTDLLEGKKVVQLQGSEYPIDGESGTVFPYTRKKDLAPKTVKFHPSVYVEKAEIKDPVTTLNANGFKNEKDQDDAHYWLSCEISKQFMYGTFIDLGAGDGTLVRRLNKIYPTMNGKGIDLSHENEVVVKGNIKDRRQYPTEKYDVALIAEQRFSDTYENIEQAKQHIRTFANVMFVYNYTTRKIAWHYLNKTRLDLWESTQN